MMKKKKQLLRESNAVFIFCRRRGLLIHHHHLLPFLSAVAGCILFLFALLSLISPPISDHHPHAHHVRRNLSWFNNDGIEVGKSVEKQIGFVVPMTGGSLGRDIWSSKQSGLYYGCCYPSDKFQAAETKMKPGRYLMIATSGGLNQQRTGITDAVVAAYILNATLVVPKLDQKSYWKDDSNFSEIFDVDWFISYLAKDVKIIKELPPSSQGKVLVPITTRAPRKCNQGCYLSRILPLLEKRHAVQLTKFDYRLSNRLATDLQKLRCRANYHALRFTDPILEMGKKLVERMRMKSKHFIALHLRYESDMLAFSGCYYGGGDNERQELGKIRKRWKTLHKGNPDKERRQGRCPLSPEEVGLMLRALGYGSDVHIYVASGEVYGGESTLAPLKALFPNLHSKETIASKEELAPFQSFSARMAALDFIACDESDVFVSNNNGNMARMLAGRRRYFGHKPTIRPNAKKLYRLFMDRGNMTWEEFASRVRTFQIGFMGEPNEIKPGRGEFHENPASCLCKRSEDTKNTEENSTTNEVTLDDHFDEDDHEHDWSDMEYLDNDNGSTQAKRSLNRTGTAITNGEHLELEEIFSD